MILEKNMPCRMRDFRSSLKKLFFILCASLFLPLASAESSADKPLRILYLEGGEYINYERVLYGFLSALHSQGLISALPARGNTREMWRFVARLPPGRLEFVRDGYYSDDWNQTLRARNKAAIFSRLAQEKDVDLILAMGTWAGVDMVTDEFHTPVMVLNTTDAYSSGLVKTPLESGRRHVYVAMDPNWLPRQLVFFHDLFRFKRLGITYDDSQAGRNAVGLHTIERIAPLLGFEIVPCSGQLDLADMEEAYRRLLDCHEKLAGQVDAMYITSSSAVKPETIAALVEPFNRRQIPTFGQDAEGGVKNGILLDIARNDPEEEGAFAADALREILAGTPPGQARHLFESMINISLNMDTARKIGWHPPFELLRSIDVLYKNQERQADAPGKSRP
jgi:ABC-type uncharacterized transport system substrate-binding protein